MRRPLLLAPLWLLAAAADAHEYWLLPDRFAAAPGERIAIEHRVGTGWPGETLPRVPARIVRFDLVDALGERPIEGADGADPAGAIALRAPGLAVAAYRSRPTSVAIEPALFELYLREEGLAGIAAQRAARGESAQPGRERFSRNAKLMLTGDAAAPGAADGRAARSDAGRAQLGAGDAALWRRPLGLALEIVPSTDPRELDAGAPFELQLLHEGAPLEGTLVKALPEDGGGPLLARTDAQGRARFVLPHRGVWLINAVHMIDAPAGSGVRWESLWSSLVFRL